MTDSQDVIRPAVMQRPAPAGFTIVSVRRSAVTTYTLFEGRNIVAENLASYGDAMKLAEAFSLITKTEPQSQPETEADPEPQNPTTQAYDLRTNIYVPVPQAAHPSVVKLIRELTEATLSELSQDYATGSQMHFSGQDDGGGDISISVTAVPGSDPDALAAHYNTVMSTQVLKGRLLTQTEATSIKVLEETQMDPMVRDCLIKLIVRLLPYS